MNGDDDEINIEFIEYIKKENENVKIYIVGNQIDSINKDVNLDIINKEYFEKFNNKIIEAMNKNLVDKYFEISVKTKQGMNKLLTSLEFDSLIVLKSFNDKLYEEEKKEIISKKKDNCLIC